MIIPLEWMLLCNSRIASKLHMDTARCSPRMRDLGGMRERVYRTECGICG